MQKALDNTLAVASAETFELLLSVEGGSSHRLLQMEFCNLRGGACDLTEVELLHQLVTAVGLRACHWRAMKHSSLKGSLRVSEQGKEGRVKWELLSAKVPTDLMRI